MRSLSITAARTPSRKSSEANTTSAARYSRTRHSSSDDDARASRRSFSVTTMPRGDFSPSVFSAACASSESSRCKAATMSCIRSCANHASILACIAATGPDVSPVAKPSIKTLTSADVVPGRTFVSASRNAGNFTDGTTASANRAWIASGPFMVCPVKPKYVPISPGECDNRKVPPTSGKKPSPTSGIASFVFSVTTRWLLCAERPTPPPITMPSMKAT